MKRPEGTGVATDLGELQNKLSKAAEQLRVNSKTQGIGLADAWTHLPRYADERFTQASRSVGPGSARWPTGTEDYPTVGELYLPKESPFEGLLNLPQDADSGEVINQATAIAARWGDDQDL